MKVKIKRLDPRAKLPVYQTAGAACFDLAALLPEIEKDGVGIAPGRSFVFGTGLAFEIPEGHVLKVYSRGGHGINKGIRLKNGTGIIDFDYRGELMIGLHNDSDQVFHVNSGDRIAQGMVIAYDQVEWEEVTELSETKRGANGFTSTGVAS